MAERKVAMFKIKLITNKKVLGEMDAPGPIVVVAISEADGDGAFSIYHLSLDQAVNAGIKLINMVAFVRDADKKESVGDTPRTSN